jgi:hypothetical protein
MTHGNMRKINYTPDNTIFSVVKIDESTGELDFDLYEDILGKEKVDAAYDEDGVQFISKGYDPDNHPVKIEDLEKFLEKAKKAGCNYISIDYNGDHPDYTFFGVDIHQATDEEIKEELDKESKERLAKAEKFRQEIERLENEAKKLEE